MTGMTADQLRKLLYKTETDNQPSNLNEFSYAGGGSSTYSFGLLQFDVGSDHGGVKSFLGEHGFTEDQIRSLSRQGGLSRNEVDDLNAQLRSIPQSAIDDFTDKQLNEAVERINHVVDRLQQTNPSVGHALAESPSLQLALADYDNQYGLEVRTGTPRPNTMISYLEGNEVQLPGRTIRLAGHGLDHQDIQSFVQATRYAVTNERAAEGRATRLQEGLASLGYEVPVAQHETGAHRRPRSNQDGTLGGVQESLNKLGYTDDDGNPLSVDGLSGPATQSSIRSFQQSSGLSPDGIAGPITRNAIAEQLAAYEQPSPAVKVNEDSRTPVSQLSDPLHSDYKLFSTTLKLVHDLDRRHGRESDHQSQNLAACLVVNARHDGLSRIDQLELSSDASKVWGAERPPGIRDHFFDRFTHAPTMESLSTPVSVSTDRWPEAMSRFQSIQEQHQQERQQAQQIEQSSEQIQGLPR